jgi:hypothetical protein
VVPPLSLLPLTDPEYGDIAERQVAESARQRVEAGEWTLADAQHRARRPDHPTHVPRTGGTRVRPYCRNSQARDLPPPRENH